MERPDAREIALPSENGQQLDNVHGQPVTRRLDELRPHPSYVRHHLTVPASQLSALVELGNRVSRAARDHARRHDY